MVKTALSLVFITVSLLAAQTTITSPAGPNGCSFGAGYTDAPYCTIPNELPLGSFVPPGPGGSYVDYTFGSKVTLLTGPGYIHPYALPSPFSAHNKYVVVREQQSGNSQILNAATGAIVYANAPFSGSG